MTCPSYPMLVLRHDEALRPAEVAAIDEHVRVCGACARRVQALDALDRLLLEDDVPVAALRARLARIPHAAATRTTWVRTFAAAIVLCALGVLCFGGTDDSGSSGRGRRSTLVASPPTSFAERVERALVADTEEGRAWIDAVEGRALVQVLSLAGAEDAGKAAGALRCLGRWRRTEALPALEAALAREPLVRTALVALGRIRSARGVPLVAPLLVDPEHGNLACRAVVEIGGPAASTCLSKAYRAHQRPVFLDALADVGGREAARVLARQIGGGLDRKRRALRALGRGGPALLSDLLDVASDSDPQTARHALRTLETLPPTDERSVSRLAELLERRSVRLAAARVLARIDTEPAVRALLQAPRSYELEPIFRLAGPGAEAALLRDLASERRRTRVRAARLLGRCGGQDSVAALAAAASERALAPTAIAALGELGAPEAVDALARLVATDPRLRIEGIRALGATGHPRAAPVLRAVARTHRALRQHVLSALSHIPTPEAVTSIVTLEDGRRLRSQAARALASMDPALVRPALVAMLDTPDRERARRALSAVCPDAIPTARPIGAP